MCPVYPNSCSLSVVAMGDKFERQSRVDFWNNIYGNLYLICQITRAMNIIYTLFVVGFNMGCMKEGVFKEAMVHLVDPYAIISSSDVVKVVFVCS